MVASGEVGKAMAAAPPTATADGGLVAPVAGRSDETRGSDAVVSGISASKFVAVHGNTGPKSSLIPLPIEKQVLVRRQNNFKVQLKRLEDELLAQLSGAEPETILDNLPLIVGLEKTKATSKEITIQVASAVETEKESPLAQRAAL